MNDYTLCPECETPMREMREARGDAGFVEIVLYCDGCGHTETE